MSRQYDVVVFGATGFTGQLVARYLSGVGQERWALAGRSREKLERVRDGLGGSRPDVLVVDAMDAEAVRDVASRTRVVATTVGPYAKYGDLLVAACAAAGTHYCDLTGEVQWMRRMIDAHHAEAQASGARIVHTCGFDSIPSDLGTWLVQKQFGDEPAEEVRLYVMYARGGFSGGTVASMVQLFEEAKDRSVRRLVADPYALNPAGVRVGADGYDSLEPRYDSQVGGWTGPFLMASVNTRVVRRTHALLGSCWGAGFRYDESMYTGKGLKGRAAAYGLAGALGGAMAGMALGPVRRLAQRTVLPTPGEGPTAEQIEGGGFLIRVVGRRGAVRHEVEVRADKDPGYGATSVMLAESARCLAYDDLTSPGGVLTPAFAMGDSLIARLNEAGVSFTVRG